MVGPPLRAEGLARRFGGMTVLAGVDLALETGETVVLLGPNGAGKTTLLRILALLLAPTDGRLLLFGSDAARAPAALRRRIGYVGHEISCYAELSAAENLAFYARLFRVSEAPGRIARLLAWAGLDGTGRRPVRTYSRGMGQRLALARALLHEPDVLILDDDAVERLQQQLLELRAAGHSTLLATHDVERAAPIASRLAILHRGRIAWAHDGRGADAAVIVAAYRAVVAGSA
ncbi:MAG: ABC transporter ATP-binding protein [Deltaproteobacteria bacterium]|nr:MAG: ABC transporter ATP-binding protein [Deltaproteobacteria bacterium]